MADSARDGSAAAGAPEAAPEQAVRSDDPPTGGLTAILGKLRDAAAAHDDELGESGGLPQAG